MADQQLQRDVRTAPWRDLVCALPGVLGAEFVLTGGDVCEVHILADQTRTPKQIVRDVQSAMLAGFQLELDHRCISVAQIPGSIREARRRLTCEQLSITLGRLGGEVTVSLRLGEHESSGVLAFDPASGERLRAVACAAGLALDRMLIPGCSLAVEEIRRQSMLSGTAILAAIRLRTPRGVEQLLGACYEGAEPDLSAVHAVLDAVNRRFSALELRERDD